MAADNFSTPNLVKRFRKILTVLLVLFAVAAPFLFMDSAFSRWLYDYGSDFSTILSYTIITLFFLDALATLLLLRISSSHQESLEGFLSRISARHILWLLPPILLAVVLNISLSSISMGVIICQLSYLLLGLVFIKAAVGVKKIIFSVVYAVIVVAGFILVIELPGRAIFWVKEKYKPSQLYEEDLISYEEPLIGYALRRNLDRTFPLWDLKTNSLGFRYPRDIDIPKPPGIYRIFLLGGSTALGWKSAKQDEHIAYYMEQRLKRLYPNANIEVINAGVPYYASWNELGLLIYRVLDCEPDMVIVFDARNDLVYAVNPDFNPIYSGYADKGSQLAITKRAVKFNPKAIINDLLRTSIVYRFLENAIFQHKEKQLLLKRKMVCKFRPEALDYYQNYLKYMTYICNGKGIKLILAYQPIIYFGKKHLTPEEKKRWGSYGAGENYVEMMQKMYPIGEEKVRQLNGYYNAHALSLRNIFEDVTETIYADECHYTPLGNRLIADYLTDYIIKNNLLADLNPTSTNTP
jgi:hypothetical protein